MSRFQGSESEWSALFAQWQAAVEAGDTEQERELWDRLRSVADDGTAVIMEWARSLDPVELDAAIAQMERVARETRAAVGVTA